MSAPASSKVTAGRMESPLQPSYQEVCELSSVTEGHVESHVTDGNGHMNVRYIYSYGVDGADLLAEQAGIDDQYRSVRRMGIFAAEHHIRFFAELREEQAFSVHPLWIDRSDRVAQVLVFMLNQTTRRVASILELAVVHVDLDSRSSVPFPSDVATEIDRRVARTATTSWPIPVSGAVAVRRRAIDRGREPRDE